MNYDEYMTTLAEQLSNKRAKELVRKEYAAHIEDQTKSFEAEGLEHDDALLLAVKEMGDPVEAGAALNKIHRARFPYGMMAVVLILTVIGIRMQGLIFPYIENMEVSHTYIYRTIFYNLVGIGIILAVLYLDYSVIMRHAYLLYTIALLGMIVLRLFNSYNYYLYVRSSYYAWVIYPIIFAALLYRNKDKKLKGLINCIVLTLFYCFCALWLGQNISSAGMLECLMIITFVMYFSIHRGLFGTCKKRLYAAASAFIVPLLLLGAAAVISVNHPDSIALPLEEYQRARLEMMLYPDHFPNEAGYVPNQLRQMAQGYSLFGAKALPLDRLSNTDLYSTFILSSIFSWFGIAVGLAVIVLLLGFCIRAFLVSIRQGNRIGMVLGLTCSISIFYRCIVFILINFGYGVYYTTSVPFLSYGLSGTLINSLMVGIILCVFRNSSILAEQEMKPDGRLKKRVADGILFLLRSSE